MSFKKKEDHSGVTFHWAPSFITGDNINGDTLF